MNDGMDIGVAQMIAQQVAAIAGEQPPRESTHAAIVLRTDVDGTMWVHIPGGADETPIHSTTAECAPGDTVAVTIANGRATIGGNATSPAATGRTVEVVRGVADTAQLTANDAAEAAASAIEDAAIARTAAASAQESAQDAETAATAATTAAGNAQVAANAATFALSDVEKVVGTLEWIAEHGEYELTEDTAIVAGKVYYTRSGTSPNYTYTVVAEPQTADIATYYELHMDESVQNFIASHLWLDAYGLNLSVDSSNGYRIHQGTVDGTKPMGTYVLDAAGASVAGFGADGAQIGQDGTNSLNLTDRAIRMTDSQGDLYFEVRDSRDEDGNYWYEQEYQMVGAVSKIFMLAFTPLTTSAAEIAESVSVTLNGEPLPCRGDDDDPEGQDGYTLGLEVIFGDYELSGYYIRLGSEVQVSLGDVVIVEYMPNSTTGLNEALDFTFGSRVEHQGYIHGPHSYALGFHNTATGKASGAVGVYNMSQGEASFSAGYGNWAFGHAAVAIGDNLQAKRNQVVLGRYNVPIPWHDDEVEYENAVLVVGDGIEGSEHNLLVAWRASLNKDATLEFDGALDVAGGIDMVADDKHISMYDSRLDASYGGVPSTGANVSRVVRMMDSDDRQVSRLLLRQAADGRRMASFESHGYDANGNDVWNRLGSIVTANGERTYDVGDPAAFCSVLHVGDYVTDSVTNVSTATSAYKDLFDFTLAAGTWMVFATFEFATNTTGRRVAMLNTTAGGTGISLQWRATEHPPTGGPCRAKLAGVLRPSASTKYYLTSWQNSGGALNVTAVVQAVRIK